MSDRRKHEELLASYEEVGNRTWCDVDFQPGNLQASRDLFTDRSLAERSPRPKELEVYGLLAGISFPTEFVHPLVQIQESITEVIGETLHYCVIPENLGVEYCVFKWPSDTWKEDQLPAIKSVLANVEGSAFRFRIQGVQINPDGCVVARGFDEGGELFRIRQVIKERMDFIPNRQSGWAHVPLGRILEPLGADRFQQLRSLLRSWEGELIAETTLSEMKLIHETRWYMEEHEVLEVYPLRHELHPRQQ